MKRNKIAIHFSIVIAILFSILFQSIHSYEHIVKQLSEKQCHHHYKANTIEIGHAHHNFEHCFTCEFTFTNSLKTDFFSFNFKKTELPVFYSFYYYKKITQSFSGALFALRAPPPFIV